MTVDELNRIAAEICGLQPNTEFCKSEHWNPCVNLTQAFMVAEKFQFYNAGRQDKEVPYYCEIYSEQMFETGGYDGTAYENSLALAITKAAIAAWKKSH